LLQTKPPMFDTLTTIKGRAATHADGRSYDRVFVSDSIARGSSGLKLDHVEIVAHRHGRKERRLYTDHFPVVATFSLSE
jgi:hypothetical protein